jgi:non-heme chloroperoxidase
VVFYGANRPGAKVTQGILDQFRTWSMQSDLKNSVECAKAVVESDFTEDLKKFDVPTLIIHDEVDQVVPFKITAPRSAKLIKNAKTVYYRGAPHGITATHQDEINKQLLAFLKAEA